MMIALSAYFVVGGLPFLRGPADMACYYRNAAPSGAIGDENSDHFPHGEMVPFPLGCRCSYFAGDDKPRIVVDESWIPTVLVYGGVVLLGAGIFTIARSRRLRVDDEENEAS